MNKKIKKSRLAGIPAWALSLLTLFASVLIFGIQLPESIEKSIDPNVILFIIYIIFLPAACFIICKTHPKSIWYTPLICNAFVLFSLFSISFSNADITFLILLSACIVLSVIAAFAGARMGRRKMNSTIND